MRNRIDTILQLEKGHEKSKITVGDDKIMSLLAHLIESLQQGEELCVNSSRFYLYDEPRLITSCQAHASYRINRYTRCASTSQTMKAILSMTKMSRIIYEFFLSIRT
jgi:hypothetical protein